MINLIWRNIMNTETVGTTTQEKPLQKKYLPAILFLAEKMAEADKRLDKKERILIRQLADAANMSNFHHDKDFLKLNEDKACQKLDNERARKAALVVLSLVLKADGMRRPEEFKYFRHVRNKLQADPISVPTELTAHKEEALKYFC